MVLDQRTGPNRTSSRFLRTTTPTSESCCRFSSSSPTPSVRLRRIRPVVAPSSSSRLVPRLLPLSAPPRRWSCPRTVSSPSTGHSPIGEWVAGARAQLIRTLFNLFRRLLEGLELTVDVQMPYRFHTKGEMARGVLGRAAFLSGWAKTISCSHPDVGRYRKKSPGQHCGYCVPCVIRRSSLAAVGLDDPGHYIEDVRGPEQTWATSRSDLRCFHMAVQQFDKDSRRHLFDVLESGPIPSSDAALHADVYRRGMVEVRNFLRAQVGAVA